MGLTECEKLTAEFLSVLMVVLQFRLSLDWSGSKENVKTNLEQNTRSCVFNLFFFKIQLIDFYARGSRPSLHIPLCFLLIPFFSLSSDRFTSSILGVAELTVLFVHS